MPQRTKLKPVTIEDAQKLVVMLDLRVSPEGEQVAFVKSVLREGEKTRGESIWTVPAKGGRARQLTQGPDDGQPRWSPDGEALAFTRKPEQDKPPQVYLLPRAGGEPTRLTGLQTGPEALRFAPDGKRVSFLAPIPDDKQTKARKEKGDDARVFITDGKPKRLWTASVKTGKPQPCSPEDLAVWEYDWLPDGKSAAVIFTEEPRLDALYFRARLGIASCKSAKIRPLNVEVRFAGSVRVSPDGKKLAFIGGFDDTPHGWLAWVVDLKTEEVTCLTPDLAGTAEGLEWLPNGSGLLLNVGEGLSSRLYTVAPEAPGEPAPVCDGLPASIDALALAPDGESVYVVSQDLDQPPEVWRVARGSGKTKQLTSQNCACGKLRLGRGEVRRWASTEDFVIEGALTLPPSFRKGKLYPTILLVHGGPAGRFRRDLGLTPRQLLANAGYAVLAPNPRGSSGYGPAFVRANFGDWGGGDLRDLLSGLDVLVEEGIADPDRLGIYGASYGGFMTAWTVTQTDRFKAAVCQCGLTELVSFHGQTDIQSFMELYFGASPYADPERYRARSALSFIDRVRTPTLFLHGEQDERVPIPQSYQMYWGLRHFGVETEFVIYPREGHGIAETFHQRDLARRVVGWFRRHL